MTASEIEDPELARYLNRSYWEQKQQHEKENNTVKEGTPTKLETNKLTDSSQLYPSAPVTAAAPLSPNNNAMKTTEVYFTLFPIYSNSSKTFFYELEVSERRDG